MAPRILYLDESGDHNLTRIAPEYPLFVLGGVVIERDYQVTLDAAVQAFKQQMFGTTDIVLHTAAITRNRGGFERLSDPAFRARFYEHINELMRSLEYGVLACALKKPEHNARYGSTAVDPYMLCLSVLIERFALDLGDVADAGEIVAEARNRRLDRALLRAWDALCSDGTARLRGRTIRRRIRELRIATKSVDDAGLQLADLVVTPIGRHVQGKAPREDFRIIATKLLRRGRSTGLYVLPTDQGSTDKGDP